MLEMTFRKIIVHDVCVYGWTLLAVNSLIRVCLKVHRAKEKHMFWKSGAGVNEVLMSEGTVKLQPLCLLKAATLYIIPKPTAVILTAFNVMMMMMMMILSSRTQNVISTNPSIVLNT